MNDSLPEVVDEIAVDLKDTNSKKKRRGRPTKDKALNDLPKSTGSKGLKRTLSNPELPTVKSRRRSKATMDDEVNLDDVQPNLKPLVIMMRQMKADNENNFSKTNTRSELVAGRLGNRIDEVSNAHESFKNEVNRRLSNLENSGSQPLAPEDEEMDIWDRAGSRKRAFPLPSP